MSNAPLNSTLGVGPMSLEVIESVFRFSHYHRKQLMLIASKNQIDYNGGYVNNWRTSEYVDFVKQMRSTYPNSDVKLCRDHCGPGFNGNYDLTDTYKTIENDIENGFDLIHIDFCHFRGNKDEKNEASKKAIERCLELRSDIYLEIGTDENFGANYSLPNLAEIENEIDFFKNSCKPEFYVVQTGSLVKEINQVGIFNQEFVKQISKLIKAKGLKLKEHNADYLTLAEIELRRSLVDSMNVAPQFGVVQTGITLSKCLAYGIPFGDFADEVYKKAKWKKWLNDNTPGNKMLCVLIAGHYHFASDEYKKIISQLEQCEDIRETLINSSMEIINHYIN